MTSGNFRATSISIQQRDLDILQGLFESRVMTANHMASLFFNGKKEATKKRLHKLKSAGLIGERKRKVIEPAVLVLTKKAMDLLRQRAIISKYPPVATSTLMKRTNVSELTLRHELQVMDVKASISAGINVGERFSVAEFSTWPLLYQFKAVIQGYGNDVLIKPDGFIRIHEKEPDGTKYEHTFFLEVDRSTETLETLIFRAGCYWEYYRSGSFAAKCGAQRSVFKEYPFRVLMVFKNAERRNNIAERLLLNRPPILTQLSLTTLEEVVTNPLGNIWVRPIDYREATKGTPFEPKEASQNWGYKTQTARELFVEKAIKKHSIFGELNQKS